LQEKTRYHSYISTGCRGGVSYVAVAIRCLTPKDESLMGFFYAY